jgi:hypothetical protein
MPAERPKNALLHVFDIRNVIGALLMIYGVLLVITGFAPALLRDHDDPAAAGNRADLYVGTDANWWVGLALLAVAAIFFAWAVLRPVPTPESGSTEQDSS